MEGRGERDIKAASPPLGCAFSLQRGFFYIFSGFSLLKIHLHFFFNYLINRLIILDPPHPQPISSTILPSQDASHQQPTTILLQRRHPPSINLC